ncbi:MAG: M14 family zinc carboxypeptidase [Phycisphaerae bacterium]
MTAVRLLMPVFAALTLAGWAEHRATASEGLHAEVILPPANGDRPGQAERFRQWRDWLAGHGIEVSRCGFDPLRGAVTVDIASADEVKVLEKAGFAFVSPPSPSGPADLLRTQSQYFDPLEIEAMLLQVVTDHPTIATVFSVASTFEGRNLLALEISDQPGVAEDEPSIQFNAQHHAREVATSNVAMDIVEQLTNGYGTDPIITQWVDTYKTVVVPMVNPDGVQYVFDVDSFWRKNRQVYACVGVDQNRNYPYLWGPGCGSSGVCTSSTYRGPSSASELETQGMLALWDQYHFTMATSYHSSGRFIDYPYACSDGSPSQQMPEHAVIDEMMRGVADGIFAVDGVTYSVFSPVALGGVNGDDTSWYYAHRGTYPFIIEVGTSFEPPFSQVAGIVNRNRGGWRYMYERLGQARIDVHVTDACTGQPLEAKVTLTDFAYDTGELPRSTFLPFGRWTYVVVANTTYTVRASAAGFVTQDVPVFVANAPAALTMALERTVPPTFGDSNCDGNVDLADHTNFAGCLTGPTGAVDAGCGIFDDQPDSHVDLSDYAAFARVVTFP